MTADGADRLQLLVVEDGPDDAALVQAQLTHLGHESTHAPDLTSAVLAVEDDEFDLILLDLGLPDVDQPLQGVRTLVPTQIPIVVVTSRNDAELALAALDAGAAQYLIKQRLDVDRLGETIDMVMTNPRGSRSPLLAAEDLGPDIDDALEMLHSLYPGVCWAVGLGDSHRRGRDDSPLAANLDLDASDLHQQMVSLGWNVLDMEAHGDLHPPHADAVYSTGAAALEAQRCVVLPIGQPVAFGVAVGVVGPDVGQLDLAKADLQIRHLDRAVQREQARIDAQLRAEAAANASQADALTGLLNRRGFDRVMAIEENRTHRSPDLDDTIFVIDLDDLKRVNDAEGHAAGDRLIRLAADTLDRAIRGSDQLFRIGGDEFVILATESTPPGADVLMQRLRKGLDDAGVQASIGSATRRGADGTLLEAFSDADHAMYRDKQVRKGDAEQAVARSGD